MRNAGRKELCTIAFKNTRCYTMNDHEIRKSIQDSFIRIADEFFILYLNSSKVNGYCYSSRLFIMGHCLELFIKANIANIKPINKITSHNVAKYLEEIDSSLLLREEVIKAGQTLFSYNTCNFDIGLHDLYHEDLEIYLCLYKLTDLKYYMDKDGKVLFPCIPNTRQLNSKYLALVGNLRNRIKSDFIVEKNERFKGVIEYLGYNDVLKYFK
jgi:hypothetical protein